MERFDSAFEFGFDENPDKAIRIHPKGVEGAQVLGSATPQSLLKHHLNIEKTDSKAFWKDGFILFKLWVTGAFCAMAPASRGAPYPYKKEHFYEFLHDHGSHISPDECSRRMLVFRAYNKYEITIIRLVEKAGINKAFAAIPHIRDESVREMLQMCAETPYHRLRRSLQVLYPRSDTGHIRQRKTPRQLQEHNERRAARAISDSSSGMIGEPPIFVPRQHRQDGEDELRAKEIFEFAMNRLGINDRDAFFLRIAELVAQTWLGDEDRKAIEQRVIAYRAGGRLAA